MSRNCSTPETSWSPIWRSRRRRCQPASGPTRPDLPPRVPHHPSASYDAAPRKGARPPGTGTRPGAAVAGPPPACAPWLTHGPQVRTGPRSWHTRRRGGPTSPNTSTPRARQRVHAGRLDATRRRRATPASGASPDGRRLRNGDGAGCDSHHPTGQDGDRLWPRPAVARAGSDDHGGEAARGEHVLPLHVHHRRWSSRPELSRARE